MILQLPIEPRLSDLSDLGILRPEGRYTIPEMRKLIFGDHG